MIQNKCDTIIDSIQNLQLLKWYKIIIFNIPRLDLLQFDKCFKIIVLIIIKKYYISWQIKYFYYISKTLRRVSFISMRQNNLFE